MNDSNDDSEDHIWCGNRNMKVGLDNEDYEKLFPGFENMINFDKYMLEKDESTKPI